QTERRIKWQRKRKPRRRDKPIQILERLWSGMQQCIPDFFGAALSASPQDFGARNHKQEITSLQCR
ncbi:MAG: hypothetical protein ACRD2O_10155, partial [Terriglobia bacterium]